MPLIVPSGELCLPLLSCLPWHRQARRCLLPLLPWTPLGPALLGTFKLQAFFLHASPRDRGICLSRQHLSSLKQFLPQMWRPSPAVGPAFSLSLQKPQTRAKMPRDLLSPNHATSRMSPTSPLGPKGAKERRQCPLMSNPKPANQNESSLLELLP